MQLGSNSTWVLVLILLGASAVYAFTIPPTASPLPSPPPATATPVPLAISPAPSVATVPNVAVPTTAPSGANTALIIAVAIGTLLATAVFARTIMVLP